PHLGTRTKGFRDPLRIVLDSHLRIPISARVLRDKHVVIATTKRAPARKKKQLEKRGIHVLVFNGAEISPKQILAELRKMDVVSVLVEGGGKVLGSFIDAGLVDKVYAFYAPILVGGKRAVAIGGKGAKLISDALHLKLSSIRRFKDTVLMVGSAHFS
ncbi:MAG TPA: dihydrofolate reductase family protein, partial [Candidatus Peribacteraceae bacterium]|nr:dihydrofolate reductase family protein [Candidatus Peribacteraceae bacterium]